jgi:hypothetical protein
MRRLLVIFALIGLGAAAPARADVTLRYRAVTPQTSPPRASPAPSPTLTIAADDAGQALIEMAAPSNGSGASEGARPPSVTFITREGVGYLALGGPQAGQQLVARQDDAIALLTPVAAGLAGGSAREGVQEMMRQRVEMVAAGTETVAGVPGQLYRIVMISGETRSPPIEIVVSADPRLAPAGRELLRFTQAFRPFVVAVTGGEPQLYAAVLTMLGHGTPLRIANVFVLDSFSTGDVPDSRFALPGPVMTREQLGQMMGAMMGARSPGGEGPPVPSPPAGAPPPTPQ